MPNIRSARPASYCSTLIETFFVSANGTITSCGHGTAFFYREEGRELLVTNWHVVTGRHPEKPEKTLPYYKSSPSHYKLHLPLKSNPNDFLPAELVPLYNDGRPIWIEHELGSGEVDLVAIPFFPAPDAHYYTANHFQLETESHLEPGIDVVIIGFPFGRNRTNPFPIWKKAMIASEPAHTWDGKPFGYLDTPGRSGMSGSPVYFISPDLVPPHAWDGSADILEWMPSAERTTSLEFVGVYSGSYGDQDFERLNLGRYWPKHLLEGITKTGNPGRNPFFP
ncbi:S1 family peptidase [Sinorhizobium medicae]|uniref:S1 family peptidase n=1 Tax=Sinorhizobium medicae TaxID=110321 RepID=UPI0018657843|nr:serine protease [Sinorhizobium medicae]